MEKTWGLDIQKARGEAAMTRREVRVEEACELLEVARALEVLAPFCVHVVVLSSR